jgi:hypothetical protein
MTIYLVMSFYFACKLLKFMKMKLSMRTQVFSAFFLACLTVEDETDRLSRNVDNYQSTLRNTPEERRSLINI